MSNKDANLENNMAVTRINNNQITDAVNGNVYVGINAGTNCRPTQSPVQELPTI